MVNSVSPRAAMLEAGGRLMHTAGYPMLVSIWSCHSGCGGNREYRPGECPGLNGGYGWMGSM